MIEERKVNWPYYLIGAIVIVLFLMPLYMVIINSFKTQKGILINVLQFPTKEYFTLSNYPEAFKSLNFIKTLSNSLMLTSATSVLVVTFSSMAAWYLVRTRAIWTSVIFMIFAASMLVPFQSVMLPLMSLVGKTGMRHPVGLVFVYVGFGSSMSIVLYHGFIKGVPLALEEAASIDGCSPLRTYWQIVFPLLKPITVTVAILNVMWVWNDYLLPSLIINKPQWQTIPLRMFFFFGQFNKKWNLALAGLMLGMIPIVIFYLFMQKHIVKSIAQGSIK